MFLSWKWDSLKAICTDCYFPQNKCTEQIVLLSSKHRQQTQCYFPQNKCTEQTQCYFPKINLHRANSFTFVYFPQNIHSANTISFLKITGTKKHCYFPQNSMHTANTVFLKTIYKEQPYCYFLYNKMPKANTFS